MFLYLIRHCESQGNVDVSLHQKIPNDQMDLSPDGEQHTKIVAGELVKMLGNSPVLTSVYYSPFVRAERTANAIKERFEKERITTATFRPDILLAEQNYGLATGCHSVEEYIQLNPDQAAVRNCCGYFWYRFPQGESLADVAARAQLFMNRIVNGYVQNIVVVSHAVFCCMCEKQITGKYSRELNWANGQIKLFEI